jgi:hypothetical protein
MHMKKTAVKILFILILSLTYTGCKQSGLADYNTPKSTYDTYRAQAIVLRVVADHRNYRRAIRCFSKEDRKWFENNFDKIEFEKEEFYENLYKSKKLAYIFGTVVVSSGPLPDIEEFTIDQISPSEAAISVPGYPSKIKLVLAGNKWRISGLFGIRKKVSGAG